MMRAIVDVYSKKPSGEMVILDGKSEVLEGIHYYDIEPGCGSVTSEMISDAYRAAHRFTDSREHAESIVNAIVEVWGLDVE